MSAAKGTVLSLTLDAVDPRLPADKRSEAAATAIHLDPILSGSTWAALLFSVLSGVPHGEGRDVVMTTLAAIAVGVVDVDSAGPDCAMG